MNHKKKTDNFHILLVEDNPDDVFLTRMAFEETPTLKQLHVVENGSEALKFLDRVIPYENVPRPHLILLDLNLTGMSGHQVLAKIKEDDRLKDIPVIILSTSTYEEDIVKCYKCHANCYITKPVDLDDFMKMIRFVENFWLDIVRLPIHD
ncbi:MAG: response regulator [Candidatus Omnitrophota bacterium]